MKANIHPQYQQATVICACGAKYALGSTQEVIHVELCSACHPFYTGQDRFVDTANRIEKFREKSELAAKIRAQMHAKKEERQARENAPKTLAEMLADAK